MPEKSGKFYVSKKDIYNKCPVNIFLNLYIKKCVFWNNNNRLEFCI